MPSGSAARKDGTAGDMAPFIIFMAFVILTTVIVISIYRINSEEETFSAQDERGVAFMLDAREPAVFSDDFLFPGVLPVSGDAGRWFHPDIQRGVVTARRLLADGKDEEAENVLRTLLLFYPDDVETICLLSGILRANGHGEEAAYYDERLSFLLPSPLPEKLPSAPDAREKRTGP